MADWVYAPLENLAWCVLFKFPQPLFKIPWHVILLSHGIVSSLEPLQFCPPLQVRYLVTLPTPHGDVQFCQPPHTLQVALPRSVTRTTVTLRYTMSMVGLKLSQVMKKKKILNAKGVFVCCCWWWLIVVVNVCTVWNNVIYFLFSWIVFTTLAARSAIAWDSLLIRAVTVICAVTSPISCHIASSAWRRAVQPVSPFAPQDRCSIVWICHSVITTYYSQYHSSWNLT